MKYYNCWWNVVTLVNNVHSNGKKVERKEGEEGKGKGRRPIERKGKERKGNERRGRGERSLIQTAEGLLIDAPDDSRVEVSQSSPGHLPTYLPVPPSHW